MSAFQYLLQVNFCLVLFYLFYILVLRKETFFRLNRIYLIATGMLSFALPLLEAAPIKNSPIAHQIQQSSHAVQTVIYSNAISPIVTASRANSWNLGDWIPTIYLTVACLLLLRFVWRLVSVYRKADSYAQNGQAYSFFQKIVVSAELQYRDTIYKHEQIHVDELHSADILFYEIIAIVNWFNPVVYGYKKLIKYIHEFIADDEAAASLPDRADYALILVSNAFGTQPGHLANSFFNQSLLKNRITMLHKNRSKKIAVLKYGLCVPLFILMLVFTSATVDKQQAIQTAVSKIRASVPARQLQDIDKLVDAVSSPTISDSSLSAPVVAAGIAAPQPSGTGSGPDSSRLYTYPKIRTMETPSTKILKVEVDDLNTIVTFQETRSPGLNTTLNKTIHIEDADNQAFYRFVKAEGIPLHPEKFFFTKENEVLTFKVYFEKIPKEVKRINIVEYPRSDESFARGITFYNYFGVELASGDKTFVATSASRQAADSKIVPLPAKTPPPLMVIDGKVYTAAVMEKVRGTSSLFSAFVNLISDPANVRKTLNAEQATELYGSEGKNGAIIIVTNPDSKKN